MIEAFSYFRNKNNKKPEKKPVRNTAGRNPGSKTQYSKAFDDAIKVVLAHEGGYVNHPNDPGGETNYGITKRTYPHLDIKNLTKDQAIEIYYNDWWLKNKYNKFPHPKFAAKVFDTAINMGAKQAHKLVQRSLKAVGNQSIVVDGMLGPKSMAAMRHSSENELLASFRSEQAGRYRVLMTANSKLKAFKTGWLKRAYS